jgi:hypothetical protein
MVFTDKQKKGGKMKKVIVVLALVLLVPFLTSCRPFCAIKGTAKGVGTIGEGVVKGTVEAVKGTGELVGGVIKATGEGLTGEGEEAMDTAKAAFEAGGEGIKGAIEESLEGVGESFEPISEGIKASESIK